MKCQTQWLLSPSAVDNQMVTNGMARMRFILFRGNGDSQFMVKAAKIFTLAQHFVHVSSTIVLTLTSPKPVASWWPWLSLWTCLRFSSIQWSNTTTFSMQKQVFVNKKLHASFLWLIFEGGSGHKRTLLVTARKQREMSWGLTWKYYSFSV